MSTLFSNFFKRIFPAQFPTIIYTGKSFFRSAQDHGQNRRGIRARNMAGGTAAARAGGPYMEMKKAAAAVPGAGPGAWCDRPGVAGAG